MFFKVIATFLNSLNEKKNRQNYTSSEKRKDSYLPNTDNSVSDQNEKNDERFNKCGNGFIVILEEGQNKGDDSGKQKDFD